MTTREIENWALRVIERVELKQPSEDFLVELKTEWLPAQKAARRIAGHANAARGEPILWLIGIDQQRGVQGVIYEELADWWSQVKTEFDGVAPSVTDLNVSWKGSTVVALLFETERAPFVVHNPAFGQSGGGPVEREVPWREGTSTRTANHNDLILLLSPLQRIPRYDLLRSHLHLHRGVTFANDEQLYDSWRLELRLYAYPRNNTQVVIPAHLCEAAFEIPGYIKETYFHELFFPVYGNSMMTETIGSGGVIDGPGLLIVEARALLLPIEVAGAGKANIKVTLRPADTNQSVVIDETLLLSSSNGNESYVWQRINYSTGERGVSVMPNST